MPHIQVNELSRSDFKSDYLKFWSWITPAVVKAVEASFVTKATSVRNLTASEAKTRTLMAKELVRVMRYELKWSKFRIRDTLKQALRLKLIGLEINLESLGRRSTW